MCIQWYGGGVDRKRKYQRKQFPEAVWGRGNDNKIKRVELNKLNRQLYDLTFVPQTIPIMTHKMSKNNIRLNYKHYKHSISDNGYMSLQSMAVRYQCPTAAGLMDSQLENYITLATN